MEPSPTLLDKALRTIRQDGWRTFFRKAGRYVGWKMAPLKRVLAPYAKGEIKRLDPATREVEFLVNFIFHRFAGLLQPVQVKSELAAVAEYVRRAKPKTVLEIGTGKGGSLFLFTRLAHHSATVVSVDLPGGKFGGGYPRWRTSLYEHFPLPSQKLHLLRLDSHLPSTRDRVQEILQGAPLDFLFIDGDHTYEGVKTDFELYAPLVRRGGVVMFHDIMPHPPESNCNVNRFWMEIKNGGCTEIVENPEQKWAGVGMYVAP